MSSQILSSKNQSLALVTGASKRLGKAIALKLGEMGYAIGLHYHTSDREAWELFREMQAEGIPVFCLKADLRHETEILKMFSDIKELPYPLEIMVNSASVFNKGDFSTMEVSEWDDTLDINLRAPWLCAREACKLFGNKKGVIINISDSGAGKVWAKFPAYILSKTALENLTRLLARTYAPNIRVNAIAPGLIEKSGEQPETEWQQLINRLPLERSGSLESITDAVSFLIHNDYVTGEILVVDGGYRLI